MVCIANDAHHSGGIVSRRPVGGGVGWSDLHYRFAMRQHACAAAANNKITTMAHCASGGRAHRGVCGYNINGIKWLFCIQDI